MPVEAGADQLAELGPRFERGQTHVRCHESLAVVTHAADHVLWTALQVDADAAGLGVLDGVVERLLHDPVERRFHGRRQPGAGVSGYRHADAGTLADLLGKELQGRGQSQVVQHARAPSVGQVAQLGLDLRQQLHHDPLEPSEHVASPIAS